MKRRNIILIITLTLLAIVAIIWILYKFNIIPHKSYSDKDFHITTYKSNIDKDNDGIDDQTDILR